MSVLTRASGRAVQLITALALLLALIAAPGLAAAQETPAMAAPFIAQIGPNATVEVPIYGFCLNYGLPFPGAALDPTELAPDQVRQAIAYGVEQGYVTTDPWQVQLAVWNFIEGAKVNEEHSAVADEIIAFVEAGPALPEGDSTAVLLPDAIAQGLVSATLEDFTNVSPAGFTFIGAGTLVLTNLTDQTLDVLIPYGTRSVEIGQSGNQDMGIFPQPDAEAPMVPKTGALLAPELLAFLSLAGLSGGALVLRRRAGR